VIQAAGWTFKDRTVWLKKLGGDFTPLKRGMNFVAQLERVPRIPCDKKDETQPE
jgi:hypothetical protein